MRVCNRWVHVCGPHYIKRVKSNRDLYLPIIGCEYCRVIVLQSANQALAPALSVAVNKTQEKCQFVTTSFGLEW